eukprot:CAMPEP_0181043822 /NCGR_PEP_ID=MMETSP1070-20121207/12921_1 /TAXON_ID=265543 /ORGANISM="Minutocellus polymorphus, Strain NH13" /LENGTH=370 /DNA_ID=CAMNT_0023122193 /DNA_START=101 /DNA_END=1214 /DNA_ORIENTATION=+
MSQQAQNQPARRRTSSLPNPADDASDQSSPSSSVVYGGEDEGSDDDGGHNMAGAEERGRMARGVGTNPTILDDPSPPAAHVLSTNNERESLFDRISALASGASSVPGSGGIHSSTTVSDLRRSAEADRRLPGQTSEPAQEEATSAPAAAAAVAVEQQPSSQPQIPPPSKSPAAAALRAVHFHRHNRILVVEGRHHYTSCETTATWYNGADSTAMRQSYTSDVRVMRRRIRRHVDLDHHTHTLNGGNYSERGLEHLVSTGAYQERAAEQSGTIQAVLAAQENRMGGNDPLAAAPGETTDQRFDRGGGVSSSSSRSADYLAQLYADMSRDTRERAERLGRADAEEAALLNVEDGGRVVGSRALRNSQMNPPT